MIWIVVTALYATALSVTPSGRFSHNSIIYDGEVWILGGAEKPFGGSSSCANDIMGTIAKGLWKYNPKKDKWSYSDVEFPERRGATLVKNNRHVYLHGGGTDSDISFRSTPTADLWQYRKGRWHDKGPAPPLYCHQSVVTPKGHLYSIGGLDESGLSNKMYKYDSKEWHELKTPFKRGIMGHTATLTDEGIIYVIGGVFGPPTEEENYNADVWSYNTVTDRWNLESGGLKIHGHSACKFSRSRAIGRAVFPEDDIVTVGGFFPTELQKNTNGVQHLGGTVQNVYSWNTNRRTWRYRGTMTKPREFSSAVGFNRNKLFIFGGYHVGNFWDDAEVLQIQE